MKPAKLLGPQCNELPSTEQENIIIRLAGPKKLGSQPFQDIELEFTSSSRAAAFVSWQLKLGSPFSENDTLYVTFCTSSLSIPEIGLNRVFEGSSRANSSKQLERYLRDDNDDVRSNLEKWQGANTPNSPLFGNNTSLANQLFGSTLSPKQDSKPLYSEPRTKSSSPTFLDDSQDASKPIGNSGAPITINLNY